jgi:hypothetical protein
LSPPAFFSFTCPFPIARACEVRYLYDKIVRASFAIPSALHRFLQSGLVAVLFGMGSLQAQAQLPAFPGAEGAGKWTVGGRSGRVIAVTNLNDSGPGSLRAAVEASGRRTVVFRTSGTLFLKSPLRVQNPYLTLAGQTAPGQGFTVAGYDFIIIASQVIVRHLRFRPGDLSGTDVDAIAVIRGQNIILDHLSTSWGVDEVLSVSPDARDVTVQWCLISESLHHSVHSSGQPHGKGSLLRGRNGARLSFHHNLYAHHADRAPMVQGVDPVSRDPLGVFLDFRNNVIYDWGSVSEGWEAAGANRNRDAAARVNFVNNAYLSGPGTGPAFLPIPQSPYYAYRYWAFEELSPHARAHWSGNTFNGQLWKNDSNNPDPTWMVSVPRETGTGYFLANPVLFTQAELPDITVAASTSNVLERVGASLRRDAVDLRILDQVANQTGDLIDSQTDVGGWPSLTQGIPPLDRDRDGLPDGWEKAYGLNPAVSSSTQKTSDGRTYLEHYHEQLLEPFPISLTVTSEGPGTASATSSELTLGGISALSVIPADGYIIDRIELNGKAVTLDALDQTPELWADTTLHFFFARPRIPLPPEFARPYAALLARHPTLNADLGGMLHFSVTTKGSFSGTLWTGNKSRRLRGQVIAREQETPKITFEIPVPNTAPLILSLDLHAAADITGQLTQDTATAALTGWGSPWHATRLPLPKPQRGTHFATPTSVAEPEPETATLRLQTTAGGLATLRVRFSDGRLALRSTRLGPLGQWLLWTRPYPGRAPTHGQGRLNTEAVLNTEFLRLQPTLQTFRVPNAN